MRRYTIEITSTDMGVGAAPGLRAIESETHGEWVRAEDALGRIAELEAQLATALQQCANGAAEIERLTAILLHVNNSLAGADQDTEHQIDSHSDTLPQYTRSLALAIKVAHEPVNDWLSARIWKEEPPP
jgi:hypothetical protein